MEDLKYFKTRIYNFKDIIGYTADYDFYNKYYIKKMEEFEIKKEYIKEHGAIKKTPISENLSLVETKKNKVSMFKRMLIKLGILVDMNEKKAEIDNEINK